jgi:hypothetical protein
MGRRRGVYFLANDFILDRGLAFLNSFRRYNRSIPLCLIPYAEDVDRLLALQDRYDFTIWADTQLLHTCDDISRSFHGAERTEQKYRKLALWEGEYDEFIYFDSDTVVLRDVGFVFEYLDRFAFVTASSNYSETRGLVWNDSIYQAGALTEEQISYAANTGFVASRKEHLRFDDIQQRWPAALPLAPHMYLETCEQPLLNYLIVTSGLSYTSLFATAAATGATDIPLERWAGLPIGAVRDGEIVSAESPPALFVHWAGLWYRDGQDIARHPQFDPTELPNYNLWSYYRG